MSSFFFSSFFSSFFSFLAFFLAAFFSALASFLVSSGLAASPWANVTDDNEKARATANNNVRNFVIDLSAAQRMFNRVQDALPLGRPLADDCHGWPSVADQST